MHVANARIRQARPTVAISCPVPKNRTEFADALPPVAASSLGHVAAPHPPPCVPATNGDPRTTSAQNSRTNPLALLVLALLLVRELRRALRDERVALADERVALLAHLHNHLAAVAEGVGHRADVADRDGRRAVAI